VTGPVDAALLPNGWSGTRRYGADDLLAVSTGPKGKSRIRPRPGSSRPPAHQRGRVWTRPVDRGL